MANTKGIIVNIKGVDTKIEYSIDNFHILGLWDRPFKTIQDGSKQIEVRTNTQQIPFDFNLVTEGDQIKFINEMTGEELITKVVEINKYESARLFLEEVGLEHSSSKPKNIDEGVKAIESHTGYQEGIKKHGLFAIKIEKIQTKKNG